jgi:hypothetical protein
MTILEGRVEVELQRDGSDKLIGGLGPASEFVRRTLDKLRVGDYIHPDLGLETESVYRILSVKPSRDGFIYISYVHCNNGNQYLNKYEPFAGTWRWEPPDHTPEEVAASQEALRKLQ